MKKMETSKMLLLFLASFTCLFTVYNCWLAYITGDLQVMMVLGGTIPTALTIIGTFITKKSERENIIKHNIDKLLEFYKENPGVDVHAVVQQAIDIEKGGNSGFNGYF